MLENECAFVRAHLFLFEYTYLSPKNDTIYLLGGKIPAAGYVENGQLTTAIFDSSRPVGYSHQNHDDHSVA